MMRTSGMPEVRCNPSFSQEDGCADAGFGNFSGIEQHGKGGSAFATAQKKRQIVQPFDLEAEAGEKIVALARSNFPRLLRHARPFRTTLRIDCQGMKRE